MKPSSPNPPTFQELILALSKFWAERGCVLQQPYDLEVGAGTMAPETFLRVLGPAPYSVAYLQPSRRPADGRYGDNPNRLFKHTQLQVILKPPPESVQEIYLESLQAIGIDLRQHDIKFEEDNWESPTLGAWGIGWQVMLDGLEITQFTYFQQCGGVDLDPISAELTYGLERIAAFLQDVDSIYDIVWSRDPEIPLRVVTYGDVRHAEELQFSVYNFDRADVEKTWEHLRLYEAECQALLDEYRALTNASGQSSDKAAHGDDGAVSGHGFSRDEVGAALVSGHGEVGDALVSGHGFSRAEHSGENQAALAAEVKRFPILAAYDLCLKCSHLFNILDSRGAISVTERVGVIGRIRNLAVGVAKAYLNQRGIEEEKPKSRRQARAAVEEKANA